MSRILWNDGHPEPEWLGALHDGELTTAEAASLTAHLEGCTACHDALELMRTLSRLAPELDPPSPGPGYWEGLEARILARVADETPAPLKAPRAAVAPAALRVDPVDPPPARPRPDAPAWRWMVPLAAVFGVALLSWRLLTSGPSVVGQINGPWALRPPESTESRARSVDIRPQGTASEAPLTKREPVAGGGPDEKRPAPSPEARPVEPTPPQAGAPLVARDSELAAPGPVASLGAERAERGAAKSLSKPRGDDAQSRQADASVAEKQTAEGDADLGVAPQATADLRGRPAAAPTRGVRLDEETTRLAPVDGGLDSLLAEDMRRLAAGLSPDSLLAETERRAIELHGLAQRAPTEPLAVERALTAARAREAWLHRLRPKLHDLANEKRIVELEAWLKK